MSGSHSSHKYLYKSTSLTVRTPSLPTSYTISYIVEGKWSQSVRATLQGGGAGSNNKQRLHQNNPSELAPKY